MLTSDPMSSGENNGDAHAVEPHLARAATGAAVAAQVAQPAASAEPPAEPAAPAEPQPPAQPAADPNVTAQFASLMRRDNRLREREQQLQQTEAEIAELRQLRENLRRDPYAVVTQHGGSLEDWSTRALAESSAATPAVPHEVASELQELRSWRQQVEQERQQQVQQQAAAAQQQQLNKVRADISSFLEATPEYQALHHAGMAEHVYQRMAQHALRTQEMYGEPQAMPIADAARAVLEEHLPALQERVRSLLSLPQFAETAGAPAQQLQATPAAPAPQTPPAQSFQENVKPAAPPPASPRARGPSSVAAIPGARRPAPERVPANREARIAAMLQAYNRHTSGGG